MIAITDIAYEQIMRVLREVHHPEARRAGDNLMLAALNAARQDIDFNEAPALCRAQAG